MLLPLCDYLCYIYATIYAISMRYLCVIYALSMRYLCDYRSIERRIIRGVHTCVDVRHDMPAPLITPQRVHMTTTAPTTPHNARAGAKGRVDATRRGEGETQGRGTVIRCRLDPHHHPPTATITTTAPPPPPATSHHR